MSEPLWQFVQARTYEDAAALDCGLFDHDESRSGHNIPCSQRPLSDCDFRAKREWIAKRRILEHARWAIEEEGGGAEDFASFALAALAAVYADHPDWREEW